MRSATLHRTAYALLRLPFSTALGIEMFRITVFLMLIFGFKMAWSNDGVCQKISERFVVLGKPEINDVESEIGEKYAELKEMKDLVLSGKGELVKYRVFHGFGGNSGYAVINNGCLLSEIVTRVHM